ncbi:aminodeoxychorismate lyase [Aurantivibrio plasticivorans]
MEHNSFILVDDDLSDNIKALDRGLAYGDGLFETMRFSRGQVPLLEAHLARLERGCHVLSIVFNRDLVSRRLAKAIEFLQRSEVSNAVIKLILTRGVGGRGYSPAGCDNATTVIATFSQPEFPAYYVEQGVDITVCSNTLSSSKSLAGIKHLNKLEYVLAAKEWGAEGFQEGLLCDNAGNIVEATSRNIFVVKKSCLYTPPIENCGVLGVLRERILIEVCDLLGLSYYVENIRIDDVVSADEVFLCNSVTGIWPVRTIDTAILPVSRPITTATRECLARKYGYN